MKAKKKKFPIQGYGIAFISLLLIIGVLAIRTTAGRYLIQKQSSQAAEPQNFFFASDLLQADSASALYYIDPTTSQFTIQLYNYEPANSLRYTTADIEYLVEVTGGTLSPTTDVLEGKSANSVTLEIVPTTPNSEEVEVKVSATKPYKKTLSARFVLAKGNQYSITDSIGNKAAVLTMINTDSGGKIELDLPEGIIADPTNSRLVKDNSSFYFISPGSGIYSLVLLKNDTDHDWTRPETEFADKIEINEK
ncbi:hypothetical protein [Holdemania massiliensis]|uniref:hypothetical protein n=1 Tax=Holdemania massiliensis TaxID=1468449 RepID=UPI001F05DEED|nr:hypothetical protein [Holdemania massiliensis]MCH1942554.1 hypothetical protein [Holdemania massiliensis]